MVYVREGVKNYSLEVTDQSVKPPGRNQNRCFLSEKEKKMHNVLKWKNIFPFVPKIFFFHENHTFRPFCIF